MPSPEAQLALALVDAIARDRWAAIGFDASFPGAVEFQQDLRTHRATPGSTLGAWMPATEPFDSVVVRMPKSRERLDMDLAMAASVLRPGGRLALVGHNDAGARSAGPHLARIATDVEVLDYRFHCRAFVSTVEEPAPFDPAAWCVAWSDEVAGRALELRSYPGVFAHGRVDPATRMLLECLRDEKVERALDAGCGNGVIGAWLCAGGAAVTCVDADAVAIEAARATLDANGAGDDAHAFPSDVYSDVHERFTHIVTNPPFHAGVRTTSEVTQRLIREAPEHLERGSELWLVANRFLDYAPVIAEAFGSFTVPAEDRKYRVYRARR